ncbi:ComEC family competence protein [Flavobacterium silvisoli]|uniref:ComEC family competence protein n=1 Tax=Flavobacterium silvisoli TaxID=2529433 RepID=A0A4Q9Z380_9FLAO|nr:ComEC/Rec2 family competence protein [Flavobacterium silvisoli]TBX70598.1 ComEC family competence protein [Flavobacterium silvisoli]
MKILQFPLIKIFIGFLLGILLFRLINPQPIFVFGSLGVSVLTLSVIHYYITRNSSLTYLFGGLALFASVMSGMTTALIHKDSFRHNHYTHQILDYDKEHQLKLLVNEKLKSTPKNNRFLCWAKEVDAKTSSGKIILNVAKKDSSPNIKIGHILKVSGVVYKNAQPFNPGLFDYSRYLENQEIYAQIYSKSHQIKPENYEPGIWASFSNFRETIISNLRNSHISKEELNVLNALILGQQQDISQETLKDYQYAGAVHVLSVSGLHVGFLWMFITFILKPIGNSKKGAFLKLGIILLSLWSFAVLAGLSPSIVRSVTMFSFVAIGTHLKRTVNIYHTLIVSMFLILLFKPSFLFDVGFQLSYLALFFILWLEPVLSQLWQPKNRIIRYCWNILTVSFAAQIGTMPLSIYYFHQFPGLFFITNLLILPLLGFIMGIGVIAILTATFHTVPFWIVKPLEGLISLLNFLIHWVASFEGFIIRNISFSQEMLVCSYIALFLLILWIKTPRFRHLFFALSGIIALQFCFIFQKQNTQNTEELIVFNSKKNTILVERKGAEVTIYSNDSILNTLDNNLTVQSYLVANFCKTSQRKSLTNVLFFKQQKILIIDDSCVYPSRINPDIIILIQSPKLNMQRLLNTYDPKQIIADGSNYRSYAKLWESTCLKAKIPFHYTNEKGFCKL